MEGKGRENWGNEISVEEKVGLMETNRSEKFGFMEKKKKVNENEKMG